MQRLKSGEIADFRRRQQVSQGNTCALCGRVFTSEDRVVLDHNHKTGEVRGAIHNGCNVALGKLENAAVRYKVDLRAFSAGVGAYLERGAGVLHPTHRTPEEKKALAKKRRVRRVAARTRD